MHPMPDLSPRLRWAFYDGVSPKLAEPLEAEGITSGPLLADAFTCIDELRSWAGKSIIAEGVASELARGWSKAAAAASVWAVERPPAKPRQIPFPVQP